MLNGKVALITGASKGIGHAIAQVFCANGASVVITGRDVETLQQAQLMILSKVPDAKLTTVVSDAADEASVKSLFQFIFKEYKCLDIFVANAGVMNDALIGMVKAEQILTTFSVNTFGAIYGAQYASRLMTRKKSGSIINISSIMGVNGNTGQAVYSASKAALIGLTKSLAKELAIQNIRVNAIAPGFIDTDMTRALNENLYKEKMNTIKFGRAGTPFEVANVALFLASDLSSYVTGQIIGVDGGMLV